MIDEICMLDHLSHGRLEVGVGRGVSPFELKYHKVEHEQSREIFIDAYKCVSAGLTTDQLTYTGPHYQYENVPIALRPLQQPHPPFWYGSSGAGRLDLGRRARPALRHARAEAASPRTTSTPSRQAFAKRGGPAQPKAEFSGGIAIGVQRHIFVDETDEKAKRLGQARDGDAPRAHQLAARQARRHRPDRADEERARRRPSRNASRRAS